MVVRFTPLGAHLFLRLSMDALADRTVGLEPDRSRALRLTLAVAAAHRICRLLASHRLAARREATVTFTPARAIPKA